MIFRKTTKPVECGLDAYRRWLRAQRPDFLWFLRQSELVQEALATEGDSYLSGCAEMGLDAASDLKQEMEEEADQALQMTADLIRGRLGEPDRPKPVPLTMAGLGERRKQKEEARKAPPPRTFLGRKPDEPEEATG